MVGHSYELPAMSWPSAQDGWLALGNDLWHSSDGGATWRRRFRLPADDLGITSVCFPDSSDGWIVCEGDDGFLMHTADGGATWQRAHLSYEAEFAAYFGPVLFSDALHGWVLAWGYDPNEGPRVMSSLLHTVDGGATWSGVGLGTSGGIVRLPPQATPSCGRWAVPVRPTRAPSISTARASSCTRPAAAAHRPSPSARCPTAGATACPANR